MVSSLCCSRGERGRSCSDSASLYWIGRMGDCVRLRGDFDLSFFFCLPALAPLLPAEDCDCARPPERPPALGSRLGLAPDGPDPDETFFAKNPAFIPPPKMPPPRCYFYIFDFSITSAFGSLVTAPVYSSLTSLLLQSFFDFCVKNFVLQLPILLVFELFFEQGQNGLALHQRGEFWVDFG